MGVTPTTELMYLKGVGPHRAEILAKRGLRTFEDLLGYLPFRYEDRIPFAKNKEIKPGQTYTVRAQVSSGSLVRYSRTRGGMYHLLVKDDTGALPCKFFHGHYLEKTFKPGQGIVLHGKADVDPLRPGRIEMINPAYELLGAGDEDSTEVGRMVPIYEALGGLARERCVTLFMARSKRCPEKFWSATNFLRGAKLCSSCIFRRRRYRSTRSIRFARRRTCGSFLRNSF